MWIVCIFTSLLSGSYHTLNISNKFLGKTSFKSAAIIQVLVTSYENDNVHPDPIAEASWS